MLRQWTLLVALLLIGGPLAAFSASASQQTPTDPPAFAELRLSLEGDGFEKSRVDQLYSHSQVFFDLDTAARMFSHSEARANYGQFAEPSSIAKAKKYLIAHAEVLAAAEAEYRVDRHIITAIILVETRLGTYLGRSAVFNTLSTLSVLANPTLRDKVWQAIPQERRTSRKRFNRRIKSRARWAYKELKALLVYTQREGLNVHKIRGSFAGALGIAQFMPSNILILAKDGNGNNRVDLSEHADAIVSIANYLKYHGWRGKVNRKRAERVLMHYNHSKYYVDAILTVAEKLKGSPWI